MSSVATSVQTFEVINSIIHDIVGYGSERKTNFTVELLNGGENLTVNLTYIDTGDLIFSGVIIQDKFLAAINSEDEKEKQRESAKFDKITE